MAKKRKHRIQQGFMKLVTKVPWMRRRYSKWILRYIDKSRTKGRTLPPELQRVERQLAKVPPRKRVEALEEALMSGSDGANATSREMRRAMARQQRQRPNGKGQRPGTVGGSRVVERR